METTSHAALTFLLNSLWQIPLVAGAAALACRLMRNAPASHRHAVWEAALLIAILLPTASMRTVGDRAETPQLDGALVMQDGAGARPAQRPADVSPAVVRAASALPRSVALAGGTASVLLLGYVIFLLFRLVLLAWAIFRTVQIRSEAEDGDVPHVLERVWQRCERAFGLGGVRLVFSAGVSGPVAVGSTIILPESLRGERSEDVLNTAIGHEMAHIARRDFACNVVYELVLLPVSFHPAARWIARGIERTREMACDELVIERLMDARVYARSIVSIATRMTALPRPGYTLGVFDGDVLEERIRRLLVRPKASVRRARMLLVTGLAVLALCAAVASSLAVSARAQGAAQTYIAQGQAALQRGDVAGATAQFRTAVQAEPQNVQAKLLLANVLLQQYIPATDKDGPLVAQARQQFLDVLALDPANRQALDGMLALTTNTKEFNEAHEWAQKAIAANASDKFAYYTAGFLAWSMSYPDYIAARTAAGMKPQDRGIIPNATARQTLRLQHGAQLDDGLRMLQTALQLDPDYSDAMAYINLLDRIRAAISDSQTEYDALITEADGWVAKALAAKRRQAQNPRPAGPPGMMMLAPPPPPPPPAPPAGAAVSLPPGAITVEGNVQQAKLVSQTPPTYPPLAKQAGIKGTVRLSVLGEAAASGQRLADNEPWASSSGPLATKPPFAPAPVRSR
jgi:beta-lactamase regulating signal transducer with metallopeptidase domain